MSTCDLENGGEVNENHKHDVCRRIRIRQSALLQVGPWKGTINVYRKAPIMPKILPDTDLLTRPPLLNE